MEKFENADQEIDWKANLERYKEKIEEAKASHFDSDFNSRVFVNLENDIEELFGTYSRECYSVKQAEQDLKNRIEKAKKEGNRVQEKVYQNIWNLINVRDIKVFNE